MTKPSSLPDPQAEPMISVPRAAAVLGVSRRHAYDLAKEGVIPAIHVGAGVRVPTAKFLAKFELTQTPTAA